MEQSITAIIKKHATTVLTVVVLFIVGILLSTGAVGTTTAQSEEELRTTTQTIQAEIDKNLAIVGDLEQQSNSLQARIQQLDVEVEVANQQIQLINSKIADIKVEVAKAQEELDRQKELLANSIRVLYKRGQVSTIELIAGSDSFGEYINEQEYLSQIKVGIADSAKKIEKLKETLEEKQAEQEALLEEQESQRALAQRKQDEQATILEETQGEQARYEGIVDDLEQQRAAAQAALQDFLSAQSFVSLGQVSTGQNVGLVGSTGFSTGPHLHFAVYRNGVFESPVAGGQTLSNGFEWPLPRSDWNNVSQGFGCVAPAGFYATQCSNGNSFHGGLDITGWYGDPVVAAADGDIIFRGWLDGYGNTVIIDHGNGLFTYYPHLLE